MARRYRRRSRNSAGALIRDSVAVGNRLPWWGSALMGAVFFILFYWMVPIWLENWFESRSTQSPLSGALRLVLEHRIHWVEYLGIVLGLVGAFFAVKNYFFAQRLSKTGETGVGIISRILGRWFD
ncbi:hypothetical protein [Thiomicrorhabdus xiamenensis]|uniref:Uncharacterized protein n=1 Tax=Thiomicrorhabdus xiamenensis TaxID=2739063 RepID=A0A7D4SSX1_9GAMM|nr:hypothetical protein [Thiomicrorhabdus xiamenensis]QKI89923.1 hypothetical protein HQN79_10220 [Thiomicrorhabdus xiamenensis]